MKREFSFCNLTFIKTGCKPPPSSLHSWARFLTLAIVGASIPVRHLYLSGTCLNNVSDLENTKGVESCTGPLECHGRALSCSSKGENDLHWNTCNSISKTLLLLPPSQSLSCKFCCGDEGIAPQGRGPAGSPEQFIQPRWTPP